MTQEEIIARRCQEGDRQAQRLLYETYAQWLLGVCLRYSGNRDTAQDLMQDGFVQILTQIDKFRWRGEGSLKAWIYTVQENVILMYLRKSEQYRSTLSLDDNIAAAEEIHGAHNWCLETILQEEGNCHLSEKLGYERTGETWVINDRLTLVGYAKN